MTEEIIDRLRVAENVAAACESYGLTANTWDRMDFDDVGPVRVYVKRELTKKGWRRNFQAIGWIAILQDGALSFCLTRNVAGIQKHVLAQMQSTA